MILGLGVEPDTPLAHVRALLAEHGVDEATLTVVATLDRRRDHPAVLALAAGRELRVYAAAALDGVAVPHPSAVVRRLVGTGSVAEAAALLAARETGGAGVLVLDKRRGDGVTVALAR